MSFIIEAACGCNTGKIRKNNEDNFYFNRYCLNKENNGLKRPLRMQDNLKNGLTVAVFDGMGGESFGEYASFAAAKELVQTDHKFTDRFIPVRKYWGTLTQKLNGAVLDAQTEMCTRHMGTTMVSLYFSGGSVYSVNLGDSRSFLFRNGKLQQLSEDHVEIRPGRTHRKAPLNRYLGIDPEDMLVEPYIAKEKVQEGDKYLLCSDGLTDMLTEAEIASIMKRGKTAVVCTQALIRAALERGGRDNVTVIVCMIK